MRTLTTIGALLLACVPATPAQAFDFAGEEFQANSYAPGYQGYPAVDSLAAGGFVVVWESGSPGLEQDGSYIGIFGQRYDGDGSRLGTEFQVNAYTTDFQTSSDVAGTTDGGFVVVWQSYGQDGSYYGIFGRRFDAAGAPNGTEFRVNSETQYGQYYPEVAASADGFIVVWESCEQDGSREGIFGQRYSASGATAGTEFRANTYTPARQRFANLAVDADGNFVVVWMSQPESGGVGQDGSDAGIFGQRYDATGAKSGTEFQINAYTTDIQARPAVSYKDDGGFVVVWEGRQPTILAQVTDEVRARKYDATGAADGSEFQLNTYTTTFEEDVSIGKTPDGELLVVWESEGGQDGTDTSGEGVFARRLSPRGDPVGTEFQVNTYTTNDQNDPRVTGLNGGRFVVVWTSYTQDGSSAGVFGQRFQGEICGDGSGDAAISASDALIALRAAVGSGSCAVCVCDVNDSGSTNATDALIILRKAVGQPIELVCSAC
jgi:hypothetical protein